MQTKNDREISDERPAKKQRIIDLTIESDNESDNESDTESDTESDNESDSEDIAVDIIDRRFTIDGETEYEVLWENGKASWVSDDQLDLYDWAPGLISQRQVKRFITTLTKSYELGCPSGTVRQLVQQQLDDHYSALLDQHDDDTGVLYCVQVFSTYYNRNFLKHGYTHLNRLIERMCEINRDMYCRMESCTGHFQILKLTVVNNASPKESGIHTKLQQIGYQEKIRKPGGQSMLEEYYPCRQDVYDAIAGLMEQQKQ